jgi:hypothetical protein
MELLLLVSLYSLIHSLVNTISQKYYAVSTDKSFIIDFELVVSK